MFPLCHRNSGSNRKTKIELRELQPVGEISKKNSLPPRPLSPVPRLATRTGCIMCGLVSTLAASRFRAVMLVICMYTHTHNLERERETWGLGQYRVMLVHSGD